MTTAEEGGGTHANLHTGRAVPVPEVVCTFPSIGGMT